METVKTIAAIATVFIGIPVALMTLVDRLTVPRHKPKTEDELAAMKAELLEPDWKSLESHFGQPTPEPLKALFADSSLVSREEFELPGPSPEETYYVAGFLAGRPKTLDDYQLPSGYFPIATDGTGGTYGFHWTEGTVTYWDHDDDGSGQELGTLAKFLAS